MRTQVKSSVRNGTGAIIISKLPSSRAHFVCMSCRKSIGPTHHTRPIASSSIRRNNNQAERPIPQTPQTHYDFFPQTFPSGPPPNTSFTPDLRQLRKEFLQLQAKAHPDLAPPNRKAHAEALSARINEAYKTLQDPLRRAQYLLSQQGIDVEDESAKLDAAGGGDADLLLEVMEAREAVEEVDSEDDLIGIRGENNARIAASVKVLEEAFGKGDLQSAAKEAVKLRYWVNIEQSIHGWEKGKGGGMNHH